MVSLKSLEKEILLIKQRNKKVELDKAWETSATRKVLIAIFTYIIISLFLFSAGIENPWLNAIVPSVAFIFSTLSLPFFKTWWAKHFA